MITNRPRRLLAALALVAAGPVLPLGGSVQGLRQLTDDPSPDYHPVFSPSGREILFTSGWDESAALFRVPAEGGDPVRVPIDLVGDLYSDWAPDEKSIVFDVREEGGPPDLYRFWPESGEMRRLTEYAGPDMHPSFSPDGGQLVFTSMRGGTNDLWVLDLDGGELRRLTDLPGSEWHPRWCPDGTRILFTSDRGGEANLWVIGTDGTRLTQLTTRPGPPADRGVWSPDGSRVAYQSGGDLWVITASGGEPERLTEFSGQEGNPAWSPDGRTIAFVSDRAGSLDIWVLEVDGR